ncbi:MAG: DUF4163 domain-containing protein [Firmicutes bacterium]|nr:DUF4163 domain-containing protein [Bacillota bacterium]
MARKCILILVLILSVLTLSSCSRGDKEGAGLAESQEVKPPAAETSGGADQPAEYQVVKKTFNDREIKIEYPQIADLSDSGKQDLINQTIRDEALKVIKGFQASGGGAGNDVVMEIGYDVGYKGAALLSIQYTGYVNVKGAAHPSSLFYTTNISIPAGNKLVLGELVNIDKRLVQEYRQGKLVTVSPHEASPEFISAIQRELDSFSDDRLIRYLGQKDTPFYLTRDSLGISLEVPHAVGDHAEFEIGYPDLQGSIKAENEVWRDVLKG